MATGYIVSGRGDLDALFMPRVSAAAADVGFKNSSGVDLSQLFEPRGATTAIANTNFINSAGTDLAQIFKDIAATPAILTATLTAGTAGSNIGYRNSASGYGAYGSMSATPEYTKNSVLYRVEEIRFDSSVANEMLVRISQASATPADADTTWTFVALSGTFSGGGGSGRKVMTRSQAYVTNTGTTPGPVRPYRTWQINLAGMNMISGNSYTFEIG